LETPVSERIAIIAGIRTPMCKAGTVFSRISADDLGAIAVSELLATADVDPRLISEVIIGNVAQPVDAANIARVIALKAGLPESTPAVTVQRNCGSGAEAITTAADRLWAGHGDLFLVGGAESMSNIPLLYNRRMTAFFERLSRARSVVQRLQTLLSFRPDFLRPVVGVVQGLTDPVTGMIMGDTAEVLAREWQISRDDQDRYALLSHQRAQLAIEHSRLLPEIVPVPVAPRYDSVQAHDNGPRAEQSLMALGKLRPYFDRRNGTVTVGNACPLTDGAAALLLGRESRVRELGIRPLGYLCAYAYAGLDPARMGLGPVHATARLLDATQRRMRDIDLVELNEAFAAQVLANLKAFASAEYAKAHLNRDTAVGEINPDRLNMNGGAIALGHPVGMTGTRLVLTLLHALRLRRMQTGLATMCIGGGQGGALLLEAA
jgi:acetyl-CoA C-acetyltransferase/acetyl-CoA acyltransferase